MKIYKNLFEKIISLENLFSAWDEFKKDKRNKRDVQQFEWNLEENIFVLHRDLKYHRYKHGAYSSFYIHDPKQRHIHKATVRDRILHHAIFQVLNPVFEPTFIAHSFSCRENKGAHKGVSSLERMARKISQNAHQPCFVLKGDIKKFFETVDHAILLSILKKRIKDADTIWLLKEIIESFTSKYSTSFERKGLPIGNLTSQLFANIYLNEFDQFVKQSLKVKNYARYTDDFVIVNKERAALLELLPRIKTFIGENLALELHPKKITIRKFHQGVDFLGYVVLPHHRVLRTKTRNRIFKKLRQRIGEYKAGVITKETLKQSLNSYLGVLSHANTYRLSQDLKNQFWFLLTE